MNRSTLLTCSALLGAVMLTLPADAFAQRRGGGGRGPGGPAVSGGVRGVRGGAMRAGPAVRGPRPGVAVRRQPGRSYYSARPYNNRAYYGRPYYARPFYSGAFVYRNYWPGANFGFFYGRPGFFGPYAWNMPFWGYGAGSYAYGMAPWGYGYGGYSGRPYGGVRIDLPQRNAEVFVDGYFVGTVDDFDGRLQQANLEAGPHRIEVREQGFEPIAFDVNIEPGRTVTYRAAMRPLAP